MIGLFPVLILEILQFRNNVINDNKKLNNASYTPQLCSKYYIWFKIPDL